MCTHLSLHCSQILALWTNGAEQCVQVAPDVGDYFMLFMHYAFILTEPCKEWEIRLANSNSPLEGRVEVCMGGI